MDLNQCLGQIIHVEKVEHDWNIVCVSERQIDRHSDSPTVTETDRPLPLSGERTEVSYSTVRVQVLIDRDFNC